ncbi:helix-turn-helix domain-containing protein [Tomitella fengzijianii]|uniref:Helix-turn-helix transcriptional regulator n=1 Tax=Tomitella fengzijianii TaxID=2597660 RepID=A0A516X725_9ACTN|nr:helix-turn-helix transcriptional regulator [Tomitella fengzijianii]QDQ98850.1 helix-turn-helix transcriptional regulator [Tomitella fengzijianii]
MVQIASDHPHTPEPPQTAALGDLLRGWRLRRGLTQVELALRAEVSTRHVSFVETGRSNPTASMIVTLCDALEVPLRERNTLLLTGGYAPAYPERGLADPPMAAVCDAIAHILKVHEPYPALVVDRGWELVDANDALTPLLAGVADPSLLEPPVNVLRLSLHPDGLAPRIANLAQWRSHLLHRLGKEIEASADARLERLYAELRGYPCPGGADPAAGDCAVGEGIIVPLRLRTDAGVLSLLSVTTVFGTPLEVTVSELAIESFYPADAATARVFTG